MGVDVGVLLPFTPRAKKVLELALQEAESLGHDYIGSGHLLLGLLREDGSESATVLRRFGTRVADTRQAALEILGDIH